MKYLSFFKTKKILSITLFLLGLGVVAFAYKSPLQNNFNTDGTPNENTNVVPVDISNKNQIKSGGLSVEAFTARENAELRGLVILNTTHSDTTKTHFLFGNQKGQTKNFYVGDVNSADANLKDMSVFIQHRLLAGESLQTLNLQGTTDRPVCATEAGVLVVCP